MTQLPPPSLPSPETPPEPADPLPRRRWAIGAAIAGSGLAIAAVVAGTSAIASSGSSDSPTAVATEALPAVENDGPGQVPPEFEEFVTGAEQFGQCLTEQLGIPMDGEGHNGSGTVIVGDPTGEGELTIIEFGEGDGTVTVERSGGDLTVESDGDVTVTDGDEIRSNLDEFFADAQTAFEACEGTLPPLDEVIGSLPALEDFNLDDFNLDDFDLEQLPNLDDFDLEQLPNLDELEQQLPNLDEFLQDLENLDLDQLFEDFFGQQN